MNTVINYASKKLSNPLHGYSYVHDSKLLKALPLGDHDAQNAQLQLG